MFDSSTASPNVRSDSYCASDLEAECYKLVNSRALKEQTFSAISISNQVSFPAYHTKVIEFFQNIDLLPSLGL